MSSSEHYSVALDSATLLVVDDDDVIAAAVTRMLRDTGATVFTRSNGSDALVFLENNHVDAVFSDLKMHEMDGFELMESVKELDNTVAVVIMSSHASPDTADQATSLGASTYLRKPFKFDACARAATKAINERRAKIGISGVFPSVSQYEVDVDVE